MPMVTFDEDAIGVKRLVLFMGTFNHCICLTSNLVDVDGFKFFSHNRIGFCAARTPLLNIKNYRLWHCAEGEHRR